MKTPEKRFSGVFLHIVYEKKKIYEVYKRERRFFDADFGIDQNDSKNIIQMIWKTITGRIRLCF